MSMAAGNQLCAPSDEYRTVNTSGMPSGSEADHEMVRMPPFHWSPVFGEAMVNEGGAEVAVNAVISFPPILNAIRVVPCGSASFQEKDSFSSGRPNSRSTKGRSKQKSEIGPPEPEK